MTDADATMSRASDSHPKPWMADKRDISCTDLDKVINPNGLSMLPSRAMDEVYPGIFVGEQ